MGPLQGQFGRGLLTASDLPPTLSPSTCAIRATTSRKPAHSLEPACQVTRPEASPLALTGTQSLSHALGSLPEQVLLSAQPLAAHP
eukprot:1671002-Alexandrium_andersonii.AAC.1